MIRLDPVPLNPLSLQVGLDLPRAADVVVQACAPDHQVERSVPVPAGPQRVPVVGLRAGRAYVVSVAATGEHGETIDTGPPGCFRTDLLPADLPTVSLESGGRRAGDGVTFFNAAPWHEPCSGRSPRPLDFGEQERLGYVLAVDRDGEVVWFHRADLEIEDVRQLGNGHLLVSYGDCMAREIDMLGRTAREWAARAALDVEPLDELGRPKASADAIPVATDTIHHEVTALENGNFLALSTELRVVPDPGRTVCGEAQLGVMGDVVVEFDPDTGAVVRKWPLMDVLDPLARPGSHLVPGGLLRATPLHFYRSQHPRPRDWSHANAVVLDPGHNALLVSLRHLDAVVALRYDEDRAGPAGELLWELGPQGDVVLERGEWFHHQHAPEIQADGSILVYDNGNGRPGHGSAGEPPLFSRVVHYDIEEAGGRPVRASQRWEHRLRESDRPILAYRLGDVDRLPNGNILVTHGHVTTAAGRIHARIMELVPQGAAGAEIVSDLLISGEDHGWCVYRSQRRPGLGEPPVEAGRG